MQISSMQLFLWSRCYFALSGKKLRIFCIQSHLHLHWAWLGYEFFPIFSNAIITSDYILRRLLEQQFFALLISLIAFLFWGLGIFLLQ